MYKEIEGNLITLAKQGTFDVITHGCNCMCLMGAGIAPQMDKAFGCGRYKLEDEVMRGDINKLGLIDYNSFIITQKGLLLPFSELTKELPEGAHKLTVVNSYTQYSPAVHLLPLDYEALTLCLRKINHVFKGQHIGLPRIGAGLAGGIWSHIKDIIEKELKDCDATVVNYKKD